MKPKTRSSCPICYSLDIFGDRWTLVIIRDLVAAKKRYYREFLNSAEGIATNILADRLKKLVANDLAVKQDDPENIGQTIYTPTEKAMALVPVLTEMANWSLRFGPKHLKDPRITYSLRKQDK